jgi:dienelactone hydrolase
MTVVLFHSVYGLRPAVRAAAGRIRATGHEVVVPDLFDGRTTDDVERRRPGRERWRSCGGCDSAGQLNA